MSFVWSGQDWLEVDFGQHYRFLALLIHHIWSKRQDEQSIYSYLEDLVSCALPQLFERDLSDDLPLD